MSDNIGFLIIVPTYNSYEVLKRFYDSIKSQSHQKWRVIFIDADSNKEHKQWLNRCVASDDRFIFFDEPEESRGIFPSMSYGAQFAKSDEWIMFLGSDDWFASNNSLSSIASEIFFRIEIYDPKIIIFGTQFLNKKNNNIIRINNNPNFKVISNKKLANFLFFGYVPAHQSLCFSSDFLGKIMPYSKNYKLAADSHLILKMLSQGHFKIIFLNKILINIQAGGLSSKFLFKRLKEVLLIYIQHYKFSFIVPFTLRYFLKIISRIKTSITLKN